MIDAICPSCGRGGSLPQSKINSRLVCRNCMQVFHVTANNLVVKGEPPPPPGTSKSRPKETGPVRTPREEVSLDISNLRTPFRLAILGLLVLMVGLLAYPYIFSGPETLEQRTVRLAQAILDQADSRIQRVVASDSWGETKRWADEQRPKLVAYRNRWPGHDLNVSALVVNENRGTGRASAIAYYSPPHAVARTGSSSGDILADSSGKTEPLSLPLSWYLDRSNQWYLDIAETAKASRQEASATSGIPTTGAGAARPDATR